MDETTIKTKLNRLADLQSALDAIAIKKQALIDAILTDAIKAQLADIDAEFQPAIDAANDGVSALTAEIKQDIISHGASVKADFLHAVYAKGRISWDTKGLDGYAVAHPEIASFRTQGQPSVAIKVAK